MKRLNAPRLIAITVSAGMVAVGLMLPNATKKSSLTVEPMAMASPARSHGTAEASPVASAATRAEGGARVREVPAPPVSKLPSLYAEPAVSAPRASPGVARPAAVRRPASDGTLPPFQPPDWSAVNAPSGTPGRSPSTLWLSGVIQGDPKVALLRRGDERFLVKEGDTIDGAYRVVTISGSSVTLARGRRKVTLRVGQ